jgi:hypothetical protein
MHLRLQSLARTVIPSPLWSPDEKGIYREHEDLAKTIVKGESCQILEDGSGRTFCHVVGGPNQGLRFEYKQEYFAEKEG